MTFYSFSNYDLLIVGIVLCVLFALIIVMLAKVLCQGKSVETPRKGKKDIIDHAFETKEFAKGIPFEEFVKNPKTTASYKILFFVNADVTARTGKSVYIRKEHHEKILKIVQVIGKNQVSLFSFIDNVLKHHFDTYQDEIKYLYDKNNGKIF